MAGMGPPPKAEGQRRRRNATVATTRLPQSGRSGKTPRWPLIPDITTKVRRDLAEEKVDTLQAQLSNAECEGKPTYSIENKLGLAKEQLAICEERLKEQRRIEASVWRELWKTPQAVQWETLGWYREVAQYVRWRVLGELGDMDAAKEARQWSDRLGLTPMAMLRLRWEVVPDEVSERRQTRTAPASRPASARERLRVVDPNVAGA